MTRNQMTAQVYMKVLSAQIACGLACCALCFGIALAQGGGHQGTCTGQCEEDLREEGAAAAAEYLREGSIGNRESAEELLEEFETIELLIEISCLWDPFTCDEMRMGGEGYKEEEFREATPEIASEMGLAGFEDQYEGMREWFRSEASTPYKE